MKHEDIPRPIRWSWRPLCFAIAGFFVYAAASVEGDEAIASMGFFSLLALGFFLMGLFTRLGE